MATQDLKRTEAMALRSSRRFKNPCPKDPQNLEPRHTLTQLDSRDLFNNIEEHKQQQITPKNEKQSTSPPNNEPPSLIIAQDLSRRFTRSSLLVPKKICSQSDLQLEAITPDDNPISKISEQPTCKKMARAFSAESFSENLFLDLSATVKKPIAKLPQNLASPYSEVRKSYRRLHRSEVVSIPYRKCHDPFEGRIVGIINKLQAGKNCLRDLESLVDRLQRISPKDMMNRYIVAGVTTVVRLAKLTHPQEIKLVERLEEQQRRLRQKIVEEWDRVEEFQGSLLSKNQQLIDSFHYKNTLIRKIYKIMKYQRKEHPAGSRELKEKAIQECQKFLGCEANVVKLMAFVKQKTVWLQQ